MTPLCFVYQRPSFNNELIHVTILGQFEHHFTGEKFYRVREEISSGAAQETLYSEVYMQRALALRVDEE